MPYKQIPNQFNGRLCDFFNENILPNLPSIKSVQQIHSTLIDYIENNNFFIVRSFRPLFPLDRNGKAVRGQILEQNNYKIIGSDNESAVWFYARCFNNDFPYKTVTEMIQHQCFPIADGRAPKTKDWNCWGRKDVLTGFLHAHLLAAKENVAPDDFKARMIRLLHPINHCLIPSPKLILEGDISEINGFKQHVTSYWKSVLPNEWDQFCEIAKPYFDAEDLRNQSFQYHRSELQIDSQSTTNQNPILQNKINQNHRTFGLAPQVGEANPEPGDLVIRASRNNQTNYSNVWADGKLIKLNTHRPIRNAIERIASNGRPIFVQDQSLNPRRIVCFGFLDRIIDLGNGSFDVHFKDVELCDLPGSSQQPPGYYYFRNAA